MDAYTQRGKKAREFEDEALKMLEEKFNNQFVRWPNYQAADFDGFIVEGDEVKAIYEFRSRDAGFVDGKIEYKDKKYETIMLTQDKIDRCRKFSKEWRLQFLFIFYCLKTRSVHCIPITDNRGEYLFPYKVKETRTQKTINGGWAVRKNAFLPLDKSVQWL